MTQAEAEETTGTTGSTGDAQGRRTTGGKPAPRQEFKIGNLYAGNVDFGVPRRVVTALQNAAEVDAALSRYVPPPGYGTAVDRLRDRNVVVIEGRSGLGRYTGALALLREVVQGDVLPISPTATLEELQNCEYERGRGYYVPEHTARESGPEAQFRWNAVCSSVRTAGAFLVITATSAPAYAGALPWQRPDLGKLLRAVLGDSVDAVPADVRERIPVDWTPTDIVAFGRRLLDGSGADEALGVFDLTATADVKEWFNDRDREWVDFIEIAALGFAGSAGLRAFESMVAELESAAEAHLPATERSDEEKERAAKRALSRRRRRSSLITEERVMRAGIPRQSLVFRSPSHRAQVLQALWRTQAVPFWNAVQAWLHEMVEDGDLSEEQLVQVAQGIVLLAEANAEEAIDSYLAPFAAGEAGEAGLACASLILRLMSLNEALAPMALQIAVGWVSASASPWHRMVAGGALMEELGARYPTDAARRLWQLISQDDVLQSIAYTAPAGLLQTLLELDSDPAPLLDMLISHLPRPDQRRVEVKIVDRVLKTTLFLLSVKDDRSGRLVVFDLLIAHPELSERVGRLWAGVLANLRYRAAALGAIWDGMLASPQRDEMARALTGALATVLTPAEERRFLADFTVIDGRKRQRNPQRAASLAHLLIDAIARIHDQTRAEDS